MAKNKSSKNNMFEDYEVKINGVGDYTYRVIAEFNLKFLKENCPEELQDRVLESVLEKYKEEVRKRGKKERSKSSSNIRK